MSSQLHRLFPLLFLPSVILRFQSEEELLYQTLRNDCSNRVMSGTYTLLGEMWCVINLVFPVLVDLMGGQS